jgi:hypothetical protein
MTANITSEVENEAFDVSFMVNPPQFSIPIGGEDRHAGFYEVRLNDCTLIEGPLMT